jgi:hypothetical protein
MARIAEDLLLLVLDNASNRPTIDRALVQRLLAAAILLDLAYMCRIRPALPTEHKPGYLVALAGPPPLDPVVRPTLELVGRSPITAEAAIAKLRKRAEDDVLDQLLRTGQIRQLHFKPRRFGRTEYFWPINDRDRVDRARSAVLGSLFDRALPDFVTASVIALLHASEALGTLLSLNDRGWQWAHDRAAEITSGSWVKPGDTAAVNLAVTTTAVRAALA